MDDFPTVTTVLRPFTDFSNVPEDRLIWASERGTVIHEVCASILMDLPQSINEEFNGYIRSFIKFLPHIKEVICVEKRFTDERMGFTGKPDFVARLFTGIAVVDLKSPVTKARTWAAQCAAYKHLTHADMCGTLRLDPNGGIPRMDWYDNDANAFPAFLNALNAWRYFKQ